MTVSLLAGAPVAAVAAAAREPEVSTPVGVGVSRAPVVSQTDGAGQAALTRRRLPDAASAEVSTSGGQVSVGGLPVRVQAAAVGEDVLSVARNRPADFVSGPARVRVVVADRAAAAAAGVSGVMVSVSPVDGVSPSGRVSVELDYTQFAELFGSNYGLRLRMVALPGCALRTPQLRECQTQTVLDSVNRAGLLSAEVTVGDTAAAGEAMAVAGEEEPQPVEPEPLVLAAVAGSSSPGSTFEVSSLSAAYSWSAGSQGGGFSWSYPLTVPASVGGPGPQVALSYDSGGIDGRTLAANGQTSWVGEGWDLSAGGYVERSYRSCAQDGGTSNAADLCWFSSYNATMVLAGRSYKLVRDNVLLTWRTDDDDALRVEQLFDVSLGNGDNDGEYWKVTTLDGTQYFFGKHKRYASDPSVTDSVLRVPVWGNNAGEPCNPQTWCMQGYRWNLDYVVDARGNSMTYFYTKFGGNYGFNGNQQTVAYDIYSYLDHIDYGTRAGSEGSGLPPQRVVFSKAYRCTGACVVGSADFPDTPWDLHCVQSSCPSQITPTFWSPYRLSAVTTQVRKADGSAMRRVDKWDLSHGFPLYGDHMAPAGPDTAPDLWFGTLTHVGYAEDDVTTQAEPVITFGGTQLWNRVDWGADIGIPPYAHFRLTAILNGVGGQTLVAYSGQECPYRGAKPSSGFNPLRCFPQYHQPAGQPVGWGWFHKYVATAVTEQDLSAAASPDEVSSYTYGVGSSTDTALWGFDSNENAPTSQRTFSIWRGYTDVTTTHGPAGGTQTTAKTLFHRGMNGESLATWDYQSMLWDSRKAALSVPIGTPGQTGAIGGVGGRCLNLVGNGTGNGTPVELWDCVPGHWGQVWQYHIDTGAFRNPYTNRCLQAMGTGNGAAVQIRDCTGAASQQWMHAPEGGLRNPVSGRCLDVYGATITNGSVVNLWDCGLWNQVWQVKADGTIISAQTRRCVDAAGTSNGAKIQSWACTNAANQQWTYQPTGSSLTNPDTGKCVDITGGATVNGTLVQLYTCNNTGAQIWVPQADGTVKNPQSGRCLDALNPPAPGNQLAIFDCNAGLTQQFAHQITDHTALAGKPLEQFTLDGPTTLLASTIHTYTVTPTAYRSTPDPGGQNLRAYMARETDTKNRTKIAATSSWRWTRTEASYDMYGQVATSRDHGDLATTGDDTCANPTYNQNWVTYLIDVVKEVLTTSCGLQSGDADLLAGVHHFYDGATTDATPSQGLPTRTDTLATVVGGVKTWKQDSKTTYDTYGRPVDRFDPLNRKTSTAYTPATGGPVTAVAVTGPMGVGWTTTTTLDPGHGSIKTVTDVNNKTTTATYDPLGRLAKVWLDNRATSSTPNRQHTYTLASPSWVHTQTLGPNANQISSYDIYDGRLRPRQTQTTAPNGKRTITDTQYDPRGLTAKTSIFYNDASGPTSTLATFADTAVDRQTRYLYDTAGRPIKDQRYDNNIWLSETNTVYDGDRVGVIPPTGGTLTQDLFDARGNVIQKRQYQHPSQLVGAFDTTSYGHDRLGQLTTVTDPATNTWTYTYDLRGRKYRTIDPDAGTSTTTFDDAGQVTSTEDGRGQKLFYEYDLLGRTTRQRADSAGGTILASWTYDTVAKGQLTAASRIDGTTTYTTAVGSYDDGYRPLSTTDTIPGFGTAGNTLTYTLTNAYTASGAPATGVVPGVGGLPGETLTYTYTDQGLPDTMYSGEATYVADTIHTYDGLITEQRLGAPGKQVKLTYQYELSYRRLQTQSLYTEITPGDFGTTAKYLYDYAYDPAGNITNAGTITDGVRDQMECFRHDHLRRLTEAWTQTSTTCTTPQRAGADPYWRKWTFDTIGNRLTQTDKNPTTGDTTWTYQVGAAAAVKPHQIKQVTSTGPLATPTRTFTYDPAGNTLTRTTDTGTGTGTTQTLGWDKEGHLATESTTSTTYLYDTNGRRLISSNPSTKTLYLPDGTELENLGTADPLGKRYYSTAVRDATGLKWIFDNHQGSSTVQVDSITLASNRRRFMPYGEPRGPQPSGWLGTKTFVGGTNDDTGLTHLGAREYDPSLGRFISVDPVMDLTDPQQWHAYSYANASPVTNSDPSGLKTCGDDTCGSGGGTGGPPSPQDESTSATNEPRRGGGCYGGNKSPSCTTESITVNGINFDGLTGPLNNAGCPSGTICLAGTYSLDSSELGAEVNTYESALLLNCYRTGYCTSLLIAYLIMMCNCDVSTPQEAGWRAVEREIGAFLIPTVPGSLETGVYSTLSTGDIFIVLPNGEEYTIPAGWTDRIADNGKGVVYQKPNPPANAPNAHMVRIMDPKNGYPGGYIRVYNQHGQPIGLDGKPGPQSATHLPRGPGVRLPVIPR